METVQKMALGSALVGLAVLALKFGLTAKPAASRCYQTPWKASSMWPPPSRPG
jgi:hypothetical protein